MSLDERLPGAEPCFPDCARYQRLADADGGRLAFFPVGETDLVAFFVAEDRQVHSAGDRAGQKFSGGAKVYERAVAGQQVIKLAQGSLSPQAQLKALFR